MVIEFKHQQREGTWLITCDQLPGWTCTGTSQAAALSHVKDSLRGYLRYAEDLPRSVRRLVEGMVYG